MVTVQRWVGLQGSRMKRSSSMVQSMPDGPVAFQRRRGATFHDFGGMPAQAGIEALRQGDRREDRRVGGAARQHHIRAARQRRLVNFRARHRHNGFGGAQQGLVNIRRGGPAA